MADAGSGVGSAAAVASDVHHCPKPDLLVDFCADAGFVEMPDGTFDAQADSAS